MLNNKILYLVVINIYGEVISRYSRGSIIDASLEKESTNQLNHISIATSNLTFENVKFMLLDKSNMKIVIINLDEVSLVIGIDKNASWAEISELFNLTNLMCSPHSPIVE